MKISLKLQQVTKFLSGNNFFDPKQSQFKSSHLTETALLSVTGALKTDAAGQSLVFILQDCGFWYSNYYILSVPFSMDFTVSVHSRFKSNLTELNSNSNGLI